MRKRFLVSAVCLLALALGVFVYLHDGSLAAQGTGPEIRFYSEPNYQGRELIVTGSAFDLPGVQITDQETFYWNDSVQSVIVVRGTWRLYQHGRSNTKLDETELAQFDVRTKAVAEGWSCLVSALSTGELGFPMCAHGGFQGDISSVELISAENLPDWASQLR